MAELWGTLKGLEICWQLGFRKVELEGDASEVFSILADCNAACQPRIVAKIQALIAQDWEVTLIHIPRDANSCVDWLAKSTLQKRSRFWHHQIMPNQLAHLFDQDLHEIIDPG
ncbi:uncharacterized protein LOC133288230 [Gastrolobium bilobum]|uniref:uncharacterized protein LOC133288230 n=1 Tax=Gastrolobium bilobum TaxID=150636 RepID=UPI002AAFF814|nr:uncharacterized protein LOC133288230 [Gastrolobium bilobum]